MTSNNKPPQWRVWILASRPHTLSASIAPCLVGHFLTNLSFSSTSTTLTWMTFCMLIQLATNLHNDYADFIKGADNHGRLGQARATQKGWLTPTETASGATLCLVVALSVGMTLCLDDPIMVVIVLSSCFNAVAYTGGPYPLGYIGLGRVSIAYSGLGDIMCFLYFGLVASLVLPYLSIRMSGDTTTPILELLSSNLFPALIQSLPMGFLSTNILVVNNLRDRHTDVKAHKQTLAVRFGRRFCQVEYTILVLLSYCVALWTDSRWNLLPLLTIPLAIPCIKAVWTVDGALLNPFVGSSARLELAFCVLQCVGLAMV